jgi:hypothetical protein
LKPSQNSLFKAETSVRRVAESGILGLVLTIRPLRPSQLEQFISKVAEAIESPSILVRSGTGWNPFELEKFQTILELYQRDFDSSHSGRGGSLKVLGLPLLAFLAVRLLSEANSDLEALVANPTTLYRNLVDLTCGKAGKYRESEETTDAQHRFAGYELRQLLWQTAVAMTIYGKESIPYEELNLRLPKLDAELWQRVNKITEDEIFSRLIISYYFRGGHTDLGAEFLHKSFREYLFAESIIEILKGYGHRKIGLLAEREPYWRDFDDTDPRYELIRELSKPLAPQWLSIEIVTHLEALIQWEIERAFATVEEGNPTQDEPAEILDPEGWISVRDALADLWDWWCEGVHLRAQPSYGRRRDIQFDSPAYVQELVDWSIPQALERNAPLPEPPRFVTMDAHLGDALFLLNVLVHFNCSSHYLTCQTV